MARAATLQRRVPRRGDQVRGIGLAPGRQQVADGTGHVAGLRAPCPRSRVQLGDVLGRAAVLELAAQDVAEDVVVAKPLAALVERYEEEIGALDLAQQRLGPALAAHGVAQRRAEAVQHAGLEEEAARPGLLGRDDLVAEVVEEVAVIRELLGVARAGPIAQRQPGEVEPGRPALGPLAQQGELIRVQRQGERVVEQRRGLGVAEPQLLAGDLVELGPRAQPRDPDRRLGPRRDDEVRGAGQVVEQEAHAIVHGHIGDQVVVVEHEHVGAPGGGQRVDQQRQRGVARGGPGSGHGGLEGGGDLEARRPQRRADVGPEARRVVVVLIERDPRHRRPVLDAQPFGQQARLAPSGGRRHQAHATVQPVAQPADEIGAADVPRAQLRRLDLGQQQRAIGHGSEPNGSSPG